MSQWRKRFSEKVGKIDSQKVLLFLMCIAFAYIFYGKTIALENVNYGIEQLHQYDNSLFKDNITLLEAEFSPRYYANLTVSLLMKFMRMSWAEIATFIIRVTFLIYAVAIARTVTRLTERYRLLYALILLSCVFRSSLGSLAGFAINGAMAAFLGTGTAIVLLALSFLIGEKKNWLVAWCLLGLAALMHVHEGMWGGCTVAVIWLALCIANKKIDWKALRGLPIYVVAMLLVTVPSLLNGETVDEALFTDIYVYDRTALHLLPSAWGAEMILKCFLMLVVPALILFVKYRKSQSNKQYFTMLMVSVSMLALWIGILMVEYIATEISHNSTIVTMYLPKCFKYVTYVVMLLYLKMAEYMYEEKRYLQGALSLFILVMGVDYSFALSMILAVLLLVESIFDVEDKVLLKEKPFYYETVRMISWELLLVLIGVLHGWNTIVLGMVGVVSLVIFILPYIRMKKAVETVLCVISAVLLVFSVQEKIFRFNENGISYISGMECMKSAMGNDIYELALEMKASAENDEEFLADPYDGMAGWVQIVAERNCYAIMKCTPSSKAAVIEWYDRIQKVEGMERMSAEEMEKLLKDIGLKYVMVYPDQYESFEQSDVFENIVKNDTAAIYRLNKVESAHE